MSVELEEPDRAPLRKAPLGLVACQVNFSEIDRRLASKGVFRYRDVLNQGAGGYGELTQIRKNQVTLQLGAFGATSTSDSSSSLGWRLATRDQAWSVALFADSVTLESRAYDNWADTFRPRLRDALTGAIEAFGPEVETRLGLRYVNALSHDGATTPGYWCDKIKSSFLGPLGDDRLGSFFTGSTTRSTFAFDDVHAVVSLAFQPDAVRPNRVATVFDVDVFREGAREFVFDNLIQAADLLNTRALQVFQSIVSPSYLDELR